jgi:hypothetical protein
MRLVHAAEKSVQNPEQEDNFDRTDQFGDDAEAEKPLRNVLNEIAALMLLRGADFLSVLGQPQREAMVPEVHVDLGDGPI